MQVAQRITAEEYLALDDLEGRRTDLVDGQVVVNEPGLPHQFTTGEIFGALRDWSRAATGRGVPILPLDVRLDEHNVYAPDVLWYSDARMPDGDAPRPYAVPDIAVEVRSPSTWRYDIGTKKSAYEREGLPELWLVDLEGRVVLVFRRSSPRARSFDVALELDHDATLHSPLLPGFALALGAIYPSS